MSKIAYMDNDYAGSFIGLIDFFYPVGCYFETSDTSFDPNVSWGGSWALETPGQVHISAGTGYTISGALSNTSDGGEKTHVLTPGETAMKDHSHTINHGHGFTQPTVNGGSHTHTYEAYTNRAIYAYHSDGNARFQALSSSTGYDGGHTHSVSGGAVTNHSGSSGGQTAANGSAHNNMQPYIIVNRWHRVA